MGVDNLLLTTEDVLIMHRRFSVPIHPKLLTEKLNPNLASSLFPQAVDLWYKELKEKPEAPNSDLDYDPGTFLYKEPKITRNSVHQIVEPPAGGWYDYVVCNENGFAHTLSINRNQGSLMFILQRVGRGPLFASFTGKFAEEKAKAYALDSRLYSSGHTSTLVNGYESDNISGLPAALFLRNWTILYHNEALKSIADKL